MTASVNRRLIVLTAAMLCVLASLLITSTSAAADMIGQGYDDRAPANKTADIKSVSARYTPSTGNVVVSVTFFSLHEGQWSIRLADRCDKPKSGIVVGANVSLVPWIGSSAGYAFRGSSRSDTLPVVASDWYSATKTVMVAVQAPEARGLKLRCGGASVESEGIVRDVVPEFVMWNETNLSESASRPSSPFCRSQDLTATGYTSLCVTGHTGRADISVTGTAFLSRGSYKARTCWKVTSVASRRALMRDVCAVKSFRAGALKSPPKATSWRVAKRLRIKAREANVTASTTLYKMSGRRAVRIASQRAGRWPIFVP